MTAAAAHRGGKGEEGLHKSLVQLASRNDGKKDTLDTLKTLAVIDGVIDLVS